MKTANHLRLWQNRNTGILSLVTSTPSRFKGSGPSVVPSPWRWRSVVLAGLLAWMLLAPVTHAVISEPDNRVWGQIVLGTSVVSGTETNIVVEARRSLSESPLASYRMGENRAAGSYYSLAIPLESVNPILASHSTRTGETILILVHNGQFVRYLTLYTVGPRGKMVRLDLGDVDSDNNGLVDNWERQFFGASGQDPNGDPDRDGVSNRNEMLGATNPQVPDARHPADTNPTNNAVTIGEVTAYALAWKTGKSWPVAPTNIPVEFVARAGFLWKNGERYLMNTNNLAAGAPLWWTNVPAPVTLAGPGASTPSSPSAGRVVAKSTLPRTGQAAEGDPRARGRISRAVVEGNSSSGAKMIQLTVTPTQEVSAYGVEEMVPVGWSAREIDGEGVFDTVSRKLRWGLFFDHEERTLNYQLVAESGATAADRILGAGSFDGWKVETAGLEILPAPRALQLLPPVVAQNGDLRLKIEGEAGRRYEIQVSSDLINWSTVGTVTAPADGQLEFTENLRHMDRQRFYRARPLGE